MSLLETIPDIKLNEYNQEHLKEILDKYQLYLAKLLSLRPKYLKHYLTTKKDFEIMNTNEAEIKNDEYVAFYSRMQKSDSIKCITEIMKKKDGVITKKDLLLLHELLMDGSQSNIAEGFRKDNNKFVGSINIDGSQRIDYIPMDYQDIEKSIDSLLDYLNKYKTNDPFIKPFVVHATLAVIQSFNDGNTRLSRLIQHAKIWELTNKLYECNLPLPALYLSKNYLITLNRYRTLQMNLAKEPSNENWNKWIDYNLDMTDEQIYYSSNTIEKIKNN